MKRILFSLFCVLLFSTGASAQVKTYLNVEENETMALNASNCVDRMGKNYLLWVRYDYKDKKACKKEAKRDRVDGKPVRMEVLYEFDEPLLTYRIISKKYFDKNDMILKEINLYNAPWNDVGDNDYSLKLGIYMTGAFNITAG